MTRVLFITPYSPESRIVGDMIYTCDILRALRHGGDTYVHLIAYHDPTREYEGKTDNLAHLVNRITLVPFNHLPAWQMALSAYPASMANRARGQIRNRLQQILQEEEYDVIMFNMLKMAYLVESIDCGAARKVYISHNVETEVSRSIYHTTRNVFNKLVYGLDYLKTRYWERRLLPQFDTITSICSADAEALKKNKYCTDIRIIRPLVDLTLEHTSHTSRRIILCGSFTWLPKQLNLRAVLRSKSIHHLADHDAELLVVGRALPDEIAYGNAIPGVKVTGAVDSVEPYYKEAAIALVPELAGGGFKLKIAEAVQHHLPIVAIKGAITDNAMKPGIDYLEADSFDSLIDTAIALLDNPPMQKQLANNSHHLFSTLYTIEAISQALPKSPIK